ncbi:MAG: DUF5666 domain-containing protein [bacterium]
MRTGFKLAVALSGALMMTAGSVLAQTQEQSIDPFTAIKPGQWVKIKGVIQQDTALAATEVKILTGAMKEDDWEIAAPLRGIVDQSNKQLEMFGMEVSMQSNATYESDDKSLKGFDGLKPGMQLEIEGTYATGAFKGREVQLETVASAQEVGKLMGKVEAVDAAARTITLMGIPCLISEGTKVRSSAK